MRTSITSIVSRPMASRQRGMTLFGLMFWAIVIGFFGYVAVVVFPTVNEYLTIKRTIDKIAAESPGTVAEVRAASWPLPGTTPVTYWFGPDGSLTTEPPADDAEPAASRFEVDPALAQQSSFADTEGNDPFHADAEYDWRQEPDGAATVFVSAPLTEDQPLIGSASADLWIRSSYQEADLGVTLSEVRPDGSETYIQSGVLRGTHRRTSADSTPLPAFEPLTGVRKILFTGVGGTGVTTVASILAMAAHIDGRSGSVVDMTGLAQKGGSVFSHVKIGETEETVVGGRVPAASTDVLIACDLLVAANRVRLPRRTGA
mgnify:CR=1 FL=1